MKSLCFNVATTLSSIVFLTIVCVFVLDAAFPKPYSPNDWLPRSLALTPNLHVSLRHGWSRGPFTGIEFFNCEECGAYRGSLVGLDGSGPETEWFDAPGIYYRLHRYPLGDAVLPAGFEWWTLLVSVWYPLALTAILPAIGLAPRLRAFRRRYFPAGRQDSQAKACRTDG